MLEKCYNMCIEDMDETGAAYLIYGDNAGAWE